MYDWNKHHDPEPIPPPERQSAHKKLERTAERVMESYGKGRCFWIIYAVLSVLLILLVALLTTRYGNDFTVPAVIVAAVIAHVVLLLGLAEIFYPETFWEFRHTFTVHNGEPTDWAILSYRLSGVALILFTYITVASILF